MPAAPRVEAPSGTRAVGRLHGRLHCGRGRAPRSRGTSVVRPAPIRPLACVDGRLHTSHGWARRCCGVHGRLHFGRGRALRSRGTS
eukprot:15455326-Alexandrium_andersonii.AAC.1